MRHSRLLLFSGLTLSSLVIGVSGCQTGRQAMMRQEAESQYEIPSMQLAAGEESPEKKQQIEIAAAVESEAPDEDHWTRMWNRLKFTPSKPIPATVTIPAEDAEQSLNVKDREAF